MNYNCSIGVTYLNANRKFYHTLDRRGDYTLFETQNPVGVLAQYVVAYNARCNFETHTIDWAQGHYFSATQSGKSKSEAYDMATDFFDKKTSTCGKAGVCTKVCHNCAVFDHI